MQDHEKFAGAPRAASARNMNAPYGSDPNGLICGYLFSRAGAGVAIDLAGALAWLADEAGAAPGDFIWLHFNLADAGAEPWIAQNLAVVPEFFEALHEGSRSTRIEDARDTLVAVVNDPEETTARGANARAHAEAELSWDGLVTRFEAVYALALERHRQRMTRPEGER